MKTYTADSELTALIKAAAEAGELLRVKAEDKTYELKVQRAPKQDIWANYDPEAAKQAWRQAFGSFRGIDAETLIEEMKAAREQDTPGRPG